MAELNPLDGGVDVQAFPGDSEVPKPMSGLPDGLEPLTVDQNAGLPEGLEPIPSEYTPEEKKSVTAAQLKSYFDNTRELKPDPVLTYEIAQHTKLPPDVITPRLSQWKAAVLDPQTDWQKLIDEDKPLAEFVAKNPYLVPTVTKLQEPSIFAKMAAAWEWASQPSQLDVVNQALQQGKDPEKASEDFKLKDLKEYMPKPFMATVREETGVGAWSAGVETVKRIEQERKVHQFATQALIKDIWGEDPKPWLNAAESEAIKITPTDYGHPITEGFAENVWPLVRFGYESNKIGIPTAVVLGIGAGVLSKGNPQAIRGAATLGYKVGNFAGLFTDIQQTAAGRYYLQLSTMTTPEGREIDRETRIGAAVIGGTIEAAVLSASFTHLVQKLGPMGEVFAKGEVNAAQKFLGNRAYAALAKKIGGQLLSDAPATIANGFSQGYLRNVLEQVVTLSAAGETDDPVGVLRLDASGKIVPGEGRTKYWDNIDFLAAKTEGFHMAALNGAIHAGTAATVGSVGFGKLTWDWYKAVDRAHQIQALTGLSATEVGSTAPKLTLDLLKQHMKDAGKPMPENLYWTADSFVETFGKKSEEVATTLFGADGPKMVTEALTGAKNGRLEIPVTQWMKINRENPALAERMRFHTSTDVNSDTFAQSITKLPEIIEEARRMVEEHKANPKPEWAFLESKLAQMREQVKAVFENAGQPLTTKELDNVVDLQRSVVVTLATRSNVTIDSVVNSLVPEFATATHAEVKSVLEGVQKWRDYQETGIYKPEVKTAEPGFDIAFRNTETGEVINTGPGIHATGLLRIPELKGWDPLKAIDWLDSPEMDKWEHGFAKRGTNEFLTREQAAKEVGVEGEFKSDYFAPSGVEPKDSPNKAGPTNGLLEALRKTAKKAGIKLPTKEEVSAEPIPGRPETPPSKAEVDARVANATEVADGPSRKDVHLMLAEPKSRFGKIANLTKNWIFGTDHKAPADTITGIAGWAERLFDADGNFSGTKISISQKTDPLGGASKTTLIHELGHTYLWNIHKMVQDGVAPKQMEADFKAIIGWLTDSYEQTTQQKFEHMRNWAVNVVRNTGAIEKAVVVGFDNEQNVIKVEMVDPSGKPTGEFRYYPPEKVLSLKSGDPIKPKRQKDMYDLNDTRKKDTWRWERDEKFAVAFEEYIRTGDAPSPGLAPAFARFRNWYINQWSTYRDYFGRYNPKYIEDGRESLPAEMRGAFDRMLATDAQIQRMALWRREKVLFKTPEEAGITDPVAWQKYVEEAAGWYDETIRAADKAALSEAIAETKSGFASKVDSLSKEVEQLWNQNDQIRFVKYVLFGEVFRNDGTLLDTVAALGKFSWDDFVSSTGREPTPEEARFLSKDVGLPLSVVADGFAINIEEAMAGLVHYDGYDQARFKAEIRSEAEKRVRSQDGSMLASAAVLEQTVADAMHNPKDKAWLLKELDILRGKIPPNNGDPNPAEAARIAAKTLFEAMKVSELDYKQILEMERRAAEQALRSSLDGNYEATYLYKKQQLMYSNLYDLVRDARTEMAGAKTLFKKMNTMERRIVLGRASPIFRDVMDQIIEALGIRRPDPTVKDRFGVDALIEVVKQENLEAAFDPDVVKRLIANNTPFEDMTVAETREIIAAVKQTWTVGKRFFKAYIKGREATYESLLGMIAKESESEPKQELYPKKTHGFWKTMWDTYQWASGANASLTDPELIFERLGPTASEFFFGKYLNGRTKENALAEKVMDPILEGWRKMPKELRDLQFKPIQADMLPWDRRTERDRTWLWMVMLNWGNAGNRKRLLEGYGWSEGQVESFFRDNNITKAEWDFVQHIWDSLNKELWPEVQKAYERVNGVKPRAVEALPIKTDHGTYAGGYFPIKLEKDQFGPSEGFMGRVLAGQVNGLRELYDQVQAAVSTNAAFTMDRSVNARPKTVDLDWSVVPSHISNVIHYISFDEAVRDMSVMVRNEQFQRVVAERLGKQYSPQINAWMYAVATGKSASANEALSKWYSFFRWGRGGLVISTLGYNLGVAMGDLVTPLTAVTVGREAGGVSPQFISGSTIRALGETGALYQVSLTPEFASMRKRAEAMSRELNARSSKLRTKLNNELRGMGGEARHLPGKVLQGLREHAWFFMEWSDKISSTIVWDAAFEQHIAEQRDANRGVADFKPNLEEAARDADKRVRNLMPSHVVQEQPSFLRDRHSVGAMVTFYSYFNKLYNMNRRIWHEPYKLWQEDGEEGDNPEVGSAAWNKAAKSGKLAKSVGMAMGRSMATLAVANVLGELASGRGKEEDEKFGQWLARKSLAAPMTMIPFIGTSLEGFATKAVTGKYRKASIRAAPALAWAESVYAAIDAQGSSKKDKWEKFWKWLEATGPITHVPARQVSRTGSYLQKMVQHKVRPRTAGEATGGLIHGENYKKPQNIPKILGGKP